jgi:hypothetical protein
MPVILVLKRQEEWEFKTSLGLGKKKKRLECSSVLKSLPIKHKALGSIPKLPKKIFLNNIMEFLLLHFTEWSE